MTKQVERQEELEKTQKHLGVPNLCRSHTKTTGSLSGPSLVLVRKERGT